MTTTSTPALGVASSSAQTVTCEIVDDFSRLESLSSDWERLWTANPRAEAFQSFAFMKAFWLGYGASLSLCACVVRRQEEVIGIVPLVRRGRLLQFSWESDYNDVICADADADAVLAACMQELLNAPFRWDTCEFDNLPQHSRMVGSWSRMPPQLKKHLQLVKRMPCPTILLAESRDETLRSLLAKESLKRHQKKLEKLGRLTFRHLESRAEIRRHLNEFFAQHIQRHAMNGDRSIFLKAVTRAFYEALVQEFDPERTLRFAVIELDGKPVAYHCGFECNGKFVWYKPAFAVDYWQQSPGEVLIRKLLEYVRDRDVAEFDFTIGDEAFKTRFANHVRYNFALYLDRRPASLRTRVARGLRSSRERLKEHPRALEALRSVANVVRRGNGGSGRQSFARIAWHVVRSALHAIFHLEVTEVFQGSVSVPAAISPGALTAGTLGELAYLSVTQDHLLRVEGLRQARERMKSGDQLYFVRRENQIVGFGFGGKHSELEIAGRVIPIDPSGPVVFLGGAQPHKGGSVLQAVVAKTLPTPRASLWAVCSRGQVAKNEIRGLGFSLRYRVIHLSVCSRFRRTWLSAQGQRTRARES